jgi:hypothetical protein
MLDCRAGDPAVLFLRQHQQRDHRGLFAALGVFRDPLLGLGGHGARELEVGRLDVFFCETTNGH